MENEKDLSPEMVEAAWQSYLNLGKVPEFMHHPWYTSRRLRPLYRRLPANPRCKYCYYPFEGIGGTVMRKVFGIIPSRLNPYLCNLCEQFAEKFQGGAEVELSILFADVRGSTGLAESMKPAEFSRLINRFYNVTTKILFDVGAMVEKLAGDAVTAFFTTGFAGTEHARVAVETARLILQATGHGQPQGPWVPVGIGLHTGLAYVGTVHSDRGISDIAVLGDTANTGARLAALAGTGEIYLSQATASAAGMDHTATEVRRLELKGRSEPVEVWVI